MMYDRDWIAKRIPHQGTMCLLDGVASFDEERLVCIATSHAHADRHCNARAHQHCNVRAHQHCNVRAHQHCNARAYRDHGSYSPTRA